MTAENKWLTRLDQIVIEHIDDASLNNEIIATKIDISERHLFRRVKTLTGMSPNKYIRKYRLELAKKYLEKGTFKTVKDTAAAVGFINISYFINQFEQEFGRKPLSVLREAGWR